MDRSTLLMIYGETWKCRSAECNPIYQNVSCTFIYEKRERVSYTKHCQVQRVDDDSPEALRNTQECEIEFAGNLQLLMQKDLAVQN